MNNKYQYPPIRNAWAGLATSLAWSILAGLLLFGGNPVYADRYVATNGADTSPYDLWTKAATNIQDAVNVAVDGETVWVSNGIYRCSGVSTAVHTNYHRNYGYTTNANEAMVVITNAINLRSWSGNYTNTVIDGNYPTWTTRVVLVVNTGAVLDGFTITNGCVYTNASRLGGAGVYFYGSLMTNCLVTGNYISNGVNYIYGAGVLLDNGIVTHCTIDGNAYKHELATGISAMQFNNDSRCGPGPKAISNCVFTKNGCSSSPQNGFTALGIFAGSLDGIVTKCIFDNNLGYGVGGYYAKITISDCALTSNRLAGVQNNPSMIVSIKNCSIVNNYYYGVVLRLNSSTAANKTTIENCTIVSNRYQGIYLYPETSGSGFATNATVANCIIYDNYYQTPGYAQPNWYDKTGTNEVYTNCCTTPMPTNQIGLPQGTGNITSAPMFVDPPGNYRLSSQSPCINTGAYRSWMDGAFDLDGNKRIFEGIVDRGAYEFQHRGTMFRIQ